MVNTHLYTCTGKEGCTCTGTCTYTYNVHVHMYIVLQFCIHPYYIHIHVHVCPEHWVTSIFTSRPVCDIWLFAAKGVVVH